ncbi:hypothetical protein J2Z60_001599 [Lactobacillus colini]|uniref:Right handed beta helix domain-containing protein n=1 Tax=Lactobacillus colini TaxID=1819254 RepID=A0ABS4MFG4_9LACO|nr:hypothetical protein [Lactobacillus colini]
MTKLVKVGARGDGIEWKYALKNVQADDVLLLEPGYYKLEQGMQVCDLTIKGTGSSPEDTIIDGNFILGGDCNFFTMENLCLETKSNYNPLFVENSADTYLTLRNVVLDGGVDNTAAIAVNGQCTLELFSVKVLGASISLFASANFRMTMNDCLVDYNSEKYSAIGIQGKGTAIISNSIIKGSLSTYSNSNCEVDLNNSEVTIGLIHGQTWMNMLNSKITSDSDSSFYISEDSWVNIVNCSFAGGVFIDKETRTIMQNSSLDRLIVCDDAKLTINNSTVNSHADFQDRASCDATRVTFSSGVNFKYFIALNGSASMRGRDLVINADNSTIAVQDDAKVILNILSDSKQDVLEVECDKKDNINIVGVAWEVKS